MNELIHKIKMENVERYGEIYAAAFSGEPWNDPWKKEDAIIHVKELIKSKQLFREKMRASGLAEIAKVLQTTPNYLLGFADNNDGFADEALGLLRDVKDQSVREILLKQIRALI